MNILFTGTNKLYRMRKIARHKIAENLFLIALKLMGSVGAFINVQPKQYS